MFTSANQSWGYTRHRYLIKHQNVWKILETWASKPDWDDEVTDVIWLKSPDMMANWWRMKDGHKLDRNEIVKDKELSFYLLQVKPR